MHLKKITRYQKGFTLVELLIVMGIIGVLATFLMLIINPFAQFQKARDTKRKSDLSKLQVVLEQYRVDTGGYPSNATMQTCGGPLSHTDGSGNTTTYIAAIPCDPFAPNYYDTNFNGSYYYKSPAGNTTYTLAACLENPGDTQGTQTNPGGAGCNSNPKTWYVVTNP